MKTKEVIKKAKRLAKPFCITSGDSFRLGKINTANTLGLTSEGDPRAREAITLGVQALNDLQELLYAQDRWAVLLIFEAMEAAGRDDAIRHLLSGINPNGCQTFCFEPPSSEDLDHDYLWRCVRCLPERGRIAIFNGSYYEETLAVRVHPELLEKQKLPGQLVGDNIWKGRFKDIRNFERYLARNGTVIRKFFLHVSKGEQKRRLLDRLDGPGRNGGLSPSIKNEREHWKDYMNAHEETIRRTATKYAPWHVVPADNKWFTRLAVASAVIDALASLDLGHPKAREEKIEEIESAAQMLVGKAAE